LFSIIQAAGWPIWPLIACSILALALVIERFLSLKTAKVAPPRLLDEALAVSRTSVPTPDVVTQLEKNSALGEVLASGFRALNSDPRCTEVDLRATMENTGRAVAHRLERYLSALATIASAAPLLGLHRAAPQADIVQVQASSGTTGSPAYVGLTRADRESWAEMTARGLYAGGIRPGDTVLHGFSMSKGFVGGVPIYQGIERIGAVDIPIGADGGVDRLLIAARDARPRCIVGTPNFLLYLAQVAPELIGMKAADIGVQRLVVGGEPGGGIPAIREGLQEGDRVVVAAQFLLDSEANLGAGLDRLGDGSPAPAPAPSAQPDPHAGH